MHYKKIYFLISAMVLVPGMIALLWWGLNPAIDFVGGSAWELQLADGGTSFEESSLKIVDIIEAQDIEVAYHSVSDTGAVRLRMTYIDQETKQNLATMIESDGIGVSELRFETVGPTLGRELLIKTVTAVGIAAVLILLYMAWRFKDRMYGICALLAMFHDSVIVLGVFSLLGRFAGVEVDALFVTALLTILSFSIHDTIVVYDRIRESIRRYPKKQFTQLVNDAVNETLVRSINNSLTIFFMLLALFLLGGESIRWFVFALLIGTVAGTYSSPFIAAPLLVVWQEKLGRKK